jgi:hypothetical protein
MLIRATVPDVALMTHSPPRQRRQSEFLNPLFDGRRMSIAGTGRASLGSGAVPSLSTSASMVSPLNPLPSPWASASESYAFSAPNSQASDTSSTATSTTTSAGGAIRLNRVPTSVKLATELIKNPSVTLSPPVLSVQPERTPNSSSTSTGSVPTPNPSPAGSVPTPSNVPPPQSNRELGPFTSLPAGPSKGGAIPHLDIGKGRPTSVPATPVPTRHSSTADGALPTASSSLGLAEVVRAPSLTSMAPPSAFKQPALPSPHERTRPSLPPEAPTGLGEPFAVPNRHRYRTSIHEAMFRPIVSPESGELSSSISPPTTGSARAVSNGGSSPSSAAPAFGLGLNMPVQSALLAAPEAGSGSLTPGAPGPRSRLRPTAGQALHMDLAGISALGDAASHASMIMQSRQAKLQRWRPNSATNVVGVTDPVLDGRVVR